jgi:methylmalonyl-CoA mutase
MSLYSEFKPSTYADWKRQLEKDLKGESFESLQWKNENGFTIDPFYTSEQLSVTYEPAFFHNGWDISTRPWSSDDKEANAQLLLALNNGATALQVNMRSRNPEVLLKGIQLNHIRTTFFGGFEEAVLLKQFLDRNYSVSKVELTFIPVEFNSSLHLYTWQKVVELFAPLAAVRTFSVDSLYFHNRGCTAVYEVALIFSMLAELANSAMRCESTHIAVRMGVSTDFFIEVAKLRSVRRLWEVLKKELGFTAEIYLIAETGTTAKSISDRYTNLLRSTVQSMGAVCGGCNELLVDQFNIPGTREDAFASRMAVNQQLVLMDECYLDKFSDVACGSYFIETLTDKIAEQALSVFKSMEEKGGYFKSLADGDIESELKRQAQQKTSDLMDGKQVRIGVNKFRNEKEELPADVLTALGKIDAHGSPVMSYELSQILNTKNA